MGGSTNREIAATLHNPEANKDSGQWANNVCRAHAAAQQLQQSFTPEERHTAKSLAPKGNTIFSAGDPTLVIEDLPPTIDEEDFPDGVASFYNGSQRSQAHSGEGSQVDRVEALFRLTQPHASA